MKKYIYSLLVLAMTAFTFSSCEDVPAPYDLPNKPETPEITTDGTEANPYTIADAKLAGEGTNVFVKAYIVGYIPEKSLSDAVFGATGETIAESNIIIAASADETNVTNCMPVQLPVGAVRNGVNLKANPSYLKQEVLLCGNIENYFGATGLKSVVYAKIGDKEYGTKPGADTPDTPAGEAKGDGTEANPFNSVAAQNLANSLESGSITDQEYYIKGKIQEFVPGKNDTGEFNAQYGNASFKIADDENSEKFYVYRVYYFGGEKWKEGDQQLKVGDEVVVCAKLTNYMGNTPETNQGGKLISINGKTSGGSSVTPTPDPTPTGDGKITFADDHKTLTLENSSATSGESVTFDFTAQGYENQTAMGTITLPDGTTITFDANGETNGPKYYTSGTAVRVYKNNKIIVTGSKSIAKIIFNCNAPYTSKGETINCDGNETATITFSGKTATYTNVFTGSTGGGVQLRFQSIEIVYAK